MHQTKIDTRTDSVEEVSSSAALFDGERLW